MTGGETGCGAGLKGAERGNKAYAVVAPPRSGGTRKLIQIAGNSELLYANYRHTNVQHALKVADELGLLAPACFYIAGRHRTLHDPPEAPVPGAFDPLFMRRYGEHYGVEPYWTEISLIKGVDPAYKKQVYTTIYTAFKHDPDELDMRGATLLIDEEPTLEFFKPKSPELFGIDWTAGKTTIENRIEELLEHVPSEIRARFPEFVKWLEELAGAPKVIYGSWDKRRTLKEHIKDYLTRLPPPPYIGLPDDEKERIACELLRGNWRLEEYPVIRLFIASLYFLDYYVHSTRTKHTVFLIADERYLLGRGWLRKWGRIAVRVNSREAADWLFNALGIPYDVEELEYPYAKNFLVFTGDVKEAAVKLHELGIPYLILVATKDEAERAWRWCKAHGIDAVIADEHTTIERLYEWAMLGRVIIFYQNSTISRGIDFPVYDITLVFSAGFACPYEEWLAERTGDRRPLERKLTQELEQCILRISPVPGYGEGHPKLVLLPGRMRLDVLKGRYFGELKTAAFLQLARVVSRFYRVAPDPESFERDRRGKPFKPYPSIQVYTRITIAREAPRSGCRLAYKLLLSPNRKTVESTLRNLAKLDDLRRFVKGIPPDTKVIYYSKQSHLREGLRRAGIRDVVFLKYVLQALREMGVLQRVNYGFWALHVGLARKVLGVGRDAARSSALRSPGRGVVRCAALSSLGRGASLRAVEAACPWT